jgi:hypothetical protein
MIDLHKYLLNRIYPLAVVAMVMMGLNSCSETVDYPHPITNPHSPLMLQGEWVPNDPSTIDFFNLPKVKSIHTVVNNVSGTGLTSHEVDKVNGGVNQHTYLVHHLDRFWVMWSDGPQVEDKVGQRVAYSTSIDGITWAKAQYITPYPLHSEPDSPNYGIRSKEGFRYISRGFWVRDGELLALASLDEADGFFGPSLKLLAFQWVPDQQRWVEKGVVKENGINNFPPKQLPSGEWMMSRRTFDYKQRGVDFLVGGIESIDSWKEVPVPGSSEVLDAEEPYWWILPDGKSIMSLYRDNRRSGYLFRAFSIDNGQSWSVPTRTNFTDTASKFHGLRLSDGRYVLVSNARPQRPRDPLVLSVSDDGLVFNTMGYLIGERWLDYPHVIEHDGYLLIAFSGAKQTVEILKVSITDLDFKN